MKRKYIRITIIRKFIKKMKKEKKNEAKKNMKEKTKTKMQIDETNWMPTQSIIKCFQILCWRYGKTNTQELIPCFSRSWNMPLNQMNDLFHPKASHQFWHISCASSHIRKLKRGEKPCQSNQIIQLHCISVFRNQFWTLNSMVLYNVVISCSFGVLFPSMGSLDLIIGQFHYFGTIFINILPSIRNNIKFSIKKLMAHWWSV